VKFSINTDQDVVAIVRKQSLLNATLNDINTQIDAAESKLRDLSNRSSIDDRVSEILSADGPVLPDLSAVHATQRDLGTLLEHRNILQAAIARLNTQMDRAEGEASVRLRPAVMAEYREIVVEIAEAVRKLRAAVLVEEDFRFDLEQSGVRTGVVLGNKAMVLMPWVGMARDRQSWMNRCLRDAELQYGIVDDESFTKKFRNY
jgi:chromosome segregation ATPase